MNSQWQQLVDLLSQPQFYPHAVTSPIQVKKTHSAIVFLTGEYAYKLKKPVNLGFLDFSTLDKRKHFLEQELRLNRTISFELYLEVIPISIERDQLILGNDSNLIEYALKMRQFPQETLLSQLDDHHQLTEEIIKKLGKVVAKFHKITPTNDYILTFGDIETIRKAIDENYEQTDQYIGQLQTEKQFQETQAFTTDYLENKTDHFLERQNQERIRECHGDLHLNNICYWHQKIYLFDRIEFNESFRFVDVMYDVAFTVMDLDARQKQSLSNLFLNTYLEQTGDWQGLQVLPFYLCRQAYVRAKVNSLLLEDSSLSESERETTIKSAQKYYHLAWQYTQKTAGKLILMSGLSGSGKTTIARQLAPQLNAIHLRSDAVRKHLAGLDLEEKGSDELYTSEMSEKTYQELLKLGKMLVEQGYTIILDAKFDQQKWRLEGQQIAQALSVPYKIIHCIASPEILGKRLMERQGDISDATAQLLPQQMANFESFSNAEKDHVISYDTEKKEPNLEEICKEVILNPFE